MADDPTPHWQPLAALPLIASIIDGELADGQEHHATLLAVRDRPRLPTAVWINPPTTAQENLNPKIHNG